MDHMVERPTKKTFPQAIAVNVRRSPLPRDM